MNKLHILFLLFLASLPQTLLAQSTARDNYQSAASKAQTLLQQWESDMQVITDLKTTYNALKTAYTKYHPDSLAEADDSMLKTATTKLNTACTNLTNKAESTKNKTVQVTKNGFDPNFHIYLCFGQSNMEGNATPELVDYSGTSKRFLTMAAVNMSTHGRTKGNWYAARPPLCRDWTGLTPADYFGKTLIKNLPDSITVGVINVALGGCAIEMFLYEGDELKNYIAKQEGWLQGYAKDYNNLPYKTLIDLAKKAQKQGVIKGILLHQGCSNNMQQDWPVKVNTIYQRMLKDLSLKQSECPLLIGELLRGGACEGHNGVIATCPGKIENSHVISSLNCPGASDRLHFTAEGYRIIGSRYAECMLGILKRYMPDYSYSVKSLKAKTSALTLPAGTSEPLYLILTDQEGNTHDVTYSCHYTFSEEGIVRVEGTNLITGIKDGEVTVTATYSNESGDEASTQFKVKTGLFLTKGVFNPSILKTGTANFGTSYTRFKSSKGGLGGWLYGEGVDISEYQYLVVNLQKISKANPALRIFDQPDPNATSFYECSLSDTTQAVIPLQEMFDQDGNKIDPSHIFIIGFAPENTSDLFFTGLELTNDDPTVIKSPSFEKDKHGNDIMYDMTGRELKANVSGRGIYILRGKKIMIK